MKPPLSQYGARHLSYALRFQCVKTLSMSHSFLCAAACRSCFSAFLTFHFLPFRKRCNVTGSVLCSLDFAKSETRLCKSASFSDSNADSGGSGISSGSREYTGGLTHFAKGSSRSPQYLYLPASGLSWSEAS